MEAEGLELVSVYPVADDYEEEQVKWAVSELAKDEFDALVVCIAGWIPTHAVLKVTEHYRHLPMVLWGLCGWMEGPRLVTTADQAGTSAIRKTFADLGYKFHAGPVNFAINGNISYLRNRLIDYGNETGASNLDAVQAVGTVSRAENGEVYPFFYGYKTDGLFQTQEEIDAYVNDKGELLQPNARPGDVRFVDFDGNGEINDEEIDAFFNNCSC